jgi:hypothetical protein
MTTDNVTQAGTLGPLFPEAKFVLVVRDGRDAGSSKVARRQRAHHPTDPFSGVDWWLERMRRVEAGLRELEPARLLILGLDAFVGPEREPSYERLLRFLALRDRRRIRGFFEEGMSPERAHRSRWREGLPPAEQERLTAHYAAALDRLEAEGSRCAPILRAVFERDA